jgi:hypothetical protein
MKHYLAVFLGTREAYEAFKALPEVERKAREQKGMQDWTAWATKYQNEIVYDGAPLGRTKKVDKGGVADARNDMGAFTVVQAQTHDDAAKMFINHPHFMAFPGDRVEIMEMLPTPQISQ